ncbi:sigma-54-dependent Fis family transcriptional regulator [Ectothiorhodospiraceae bacterium BW-2]|nr:sigma-54-dependent Fis family transcriptional regulator [Ectothiorhodospiraceae bacterium BW-2]
MSFRPTALIVDDEPDILELLALTLSRMGVESRAAASLEQAFRMLQQQPFHLCLTDMRLPDGDGLELVRYISSELPQLPVAVITAHGNMDCAIEALKAGAFDFVNKPVELKTLKALIESALKLSRGDSEPSADRASEEASFLGEAAVVIELRQTVRKLARSQAPIYIKGESGTGKELIARMIHRLSPRAERPFIAVNCGAIPAELIESELFGHVKGSFTGATQNKQGLFVAADGGTLFLDEIAELPLEMQVKLLRVIQERRVRPVGSEREQAIDIRILSATHQHLAARVREGLFREDLYFRINVIELELPSLRQRREDIPLLVDHIVQRICRRLQQLPIKLSPQALETLQHYPFPGNVRELENILERALTLSDGSMVGVDDLRLQLPEPEELQRERLDEGARVLLWAEEVGLDACMEQIERSVLQQALQQCRFNKTAAAKRLGISFRSLRYRLQRLGIE